jgi:hypothetical protein
MKGLLPKQNPAYWVGLGTRSAHLEQSWAISTRAVLALLRRMTRTPGG